MKTRNALTTAKTILAAAAAASLGALFFALPALAQVDLGLQYATATGLTTTDIRTTIARVISIFLGLLGIIAVGLILYAGFVWMTAAGNEEKILQAKKIMTNAVIGLVIIMSAFGIVQFILRAITGADQNGGQGGDGGAGGGGFGAGGSAFMVQRTMPAGPGPGQKGWPKNYSIIVSFNGPVSEASVNSASFIVKRCDQRVDGQVPANFTCDTVVSGIPKVEGNRIIFNPDSTPIKEEGDKVTFFEGNYWYSVEVKGGVSGLESNVLRDTNDPGRVLRCVYPPGVKISDTSSSASTLCARVVAFNNMVDITPPAVTVRVPQSPPGYCGASIPVEAQATDDFLPARVDFRIIDDAGVDQSAALKPVAYAENDLYLNPLDIRSIHIDTATLIAGKTYILTATPQDGVPQTGTTASTSFRTKLPQCCSGECGPPDKSQCGRCSADDCPPADQACIDAAKCTKNEDCASEMCVDGKCVNFPVIDSVTPVSAGSGSPVTIKGRFFGKTPGKVFFLGNYDNQNDDRQAAPCSPSNWWYEDTPGVWVASVLVPDNAKNGPIRLTTAFNMSDDTSDRVPAGRPTPARR